MVSLPIKLHYNEEVIETVVSTNIEIFIEYIMDTPLGICHQNLSRDLVIWGVRVVTWLVVSPRVV